MNRTLQPLNQAGFTKYGDVIEHQGDQRRRALSIDFTAEHDDMRRAFWVSKVVEATTLPARIKFLERHPFSDQAFVPLRDTSFLVVACPDNPDGGPDLDRLNAYIASPGQGVIYRRNVWHAPLSALTAPAEFFVTMGITDKAANDEFYELPIPLAIDPEA
ncbi:ureidoglycolate lyase [Rhizobium sp. BK529]|uniref:ureidoglycolate lyase n=1 Tax=Rhizobium sp. BK529 TaxID=2586983 RepID=UPI00161BF7F0|nr:ureidoglycolate lyase [Rhizobium sp. BK529]MBB3595232.1 ureidoglycolate lyase [Rhizobium sp. BK529]